MANQDSNQHYSLDFDHLRSEGILQIRRLSGQRWTDHNTHDPGITLLETLCYALTELAYRSKFSIPDLLGASGTSKLQQRYGPAQMLPGAPISIRDLRRLLLDAAGAQGARIEAAPDTNPKLYYHPYDLALSLTPVEGATPLTPVGFLNAGYAGSEGKAARATLLANRPLCADWLEIKDMGAEPILIRVELELTSDTAQPEVVAQLAFRALNETITPIARFQNYAEALRLGSSADVVFEGPLLSEGFLPEKELDRLAQGDFLRASDLIQALMDVPGVKAVKNIRMGKDGERWLFPLTPGKYPNLASNSEITLFRATLRESFRYKEEYLTAESLATSALLQTTNEQIKKADRNLGAFHPIRYQLPAFYGLQSDALPEDPQKRAEYLQLSAYLLFFEQLLADTAAQLAYFRSLFDFEAESTTTYTVKVLRNIPGAMALFGWSEGSDEDAFAQQLEADLQQVVEPAPAQRLNRLLDHLLARFAENFADYALVVAGNPEQQALLPQAKRAFLQDYPEIGLRRGTGCDLSDPYSRSGLEHRIARLLGLPWPPKEAGNGDQDEDDAREAIGRGEVFFLIEHILLRPVPKDLTNGNDEYLLTDLSQADPFSRQLTFVFPNYSARFAPGKEWETYQNLLLTTLRRETPAHLISNVLLLDWSGLESFSNAYRTWREALANPEGIDNNAYRVARDRIIDLMVEMNQVVGQKPTVKRFLLGWSLPILDLQVRVPIVAPGTRAPIVLLNSQAGVTYILCDRLGEPVKDADNALISVSGTGYDLEILLPAISKDTTFLLKAQKNLPGLSSPSGGFLRQKLRIRVGIDTKIPVRLLDLEIDYNAGTQVQLGNTQAEVYYDLINAKNESILLNPSKPEGEEGNQGLPILLQTKGLLEDTSFRVRATRIFGNAKDVQMIEGEYAIRVRPNPGLTTLASPLLVVYNSAVTVTINQTQASAKYQAFIRPIRDKEFINTELPASWTAAGLASILSNLGLRYNSIAPNDFSQIGTPTPGTGNNIVVNLGTLQEDTRFLIAAKKDNHLQGVLLTNSFQGAVLVYPNPNVQAQLAATQIDAGQAAVVQIAAPQPGVWYKLFKKGDTNELAAAYYNNTLLNSPGEDGIEAVRLEYDFFVGETLTPPLILTSPALTADTEFEVVAEKVQTGLKVTLNAVLKATIK